MTPTPGAPTPSSFLPPGLPPSATGGQLTDQEIAAVIASLTSANITGVVFPDLSTFTPGGMPIDSYAYVFYNLLTIASWPAAIKDFYQNYGALSLNPATTSQAKAKLAAALATGWPIDFQQCFSNPASLTNQRAAWGYTSIPQYGQPQSYPPGPTSGGIPVSFVPPAEPPTAPTAPTGPGLVLGPQLNFGVVAPGSPGAEYGLPVGMLASSAPQTSVSSQGWPLALYVDPVISWGGFREVYYIVTAPVASAAA